MQNEVTAIDRVGKTVAVKNHATGEMYKESYDTLVLSMGAEPIRPPIPGIESRRVFTVRNIPDTYRIKEFIDSQKPKAAIVVGGGYIGLEMAENLRDAGIVVTIVEMQDQVMGPLDYDMACDVHHHIRSKGVGLLLGTAVRSIEEKEDGLSVTTSAETLSADLLVMAIGVRPESAIAAEAGLETNGRGGIVIDNHMRTADPDIYAVGDAIEVMDFVTGQKTMIPLAGPANRQGRIAADCICGRSASYTGTQGSAILKVFDMTVATTGLNEKTAQKLGIAAEKSYTFSGSHAGYYPGATSMSVKLLFAPDTGKVLGAQITGFEGVDKRCDVIATAIRFGATVRELAQLELCYAPPYSSAKDPVNMAGMVAENLLDGLVENFHWHDVAELQKDEAALLLDIRTPYEYSRGHIEGSVNIPVDSLRERLGELEQYKEKTAYVICQVGLRGYVGCRILTQHGFRCKNLGGGYRLYQSVLG